MRYETPIGKNTKAADKASAMKRKIRIGRYCARSTKTLPQAARRQSARTVWCASKPLLPLTQGCESCNSHHFRCTGFQAKPNKAQTRLKKSPKQASKNGPITLGLKHGLNRFCRGLAVGRLEPAKLCNINFGLGINAARMAELSEAFDPVIAANARWPNSAKRQVFH